MATFYPVFPGFHPLISGENGENDFPGGGGGGGRFENTRAYARVD